MEELFLNIIWRKFSYSFEHPTIKSTFIPFISPYILYTGAADPRKNIENLLHAYSLLSSELISKFKLVNKIRLICRTSLLKVNGKIGAEALIELVIVRKKDDKLKFVRELPVGIEKIFLLLEKGQVI